jgi:ABC-type antimicrobial peptide transport system permease subunit
MPLAYVPLAQTSDGFLRLVHGWFRPTFIVRSSLPSAATTAAIRQALATVDPLLPIASVRSMSDVQAMSLAPQRLLAALLLGLALATVAVAAIGIHGLIATSVAERTREIGIRLALGSTVGQAIRALALPGVVLAMCGIAVGIATALGTGTFLAHFIWGISVADPMTYVGVSVFFLLVSAAASLAPALRIARLDPATTLRAD